MVASSVPKPVRTIAAVCFAIAVMAGVSNCAVAATETPSADTSETSCPHPLDKDGNRLWKPTDSELHLILARHRGYLFRERHPDLDLQKADGASLQDAYLDNAFPDWRKEARKNPEKANLCNADLSKANLLGAGLYRANLSGARLVAANLSGADLQFANVSGADLFEAKLSDANLFRTNLSGADVGAANLSGAVLFQANLSGAYLTSADLPGADLRSANLLGTSLFGARLPGADLTDAKVSKAKLAYVNLTGSTYAPASEPPDPYVAGIEGLATLNAAKGQQIGLFQLRKLFQDAGLDESEREVTSSIQRNRTRDQLSSELWSVAWIEGILRRVGFGWTTAYGLHPERALGLILLLGVILTPVYMRVMLHPTQTSRIVLVFPQDRVDMVDADSSSEQPRMKVAKATSWWSAFGWAVVYFAFVSGKHRLRTIYPWRLDSPPARPRLLSTAVGWVRTVAGGQSLVSVYLLAMWVLTQFGRPFG